MSKPWIVILAGVALSACSQPSRPTTQSGTAAVLEAYVRAWNQHDSLALDSLLAPGAIHEDLAQGFRGEGAQQVKVFMAELIKLEPDFNWQLTSWFADGSRIAAEWTWTSSYTGPSPIGPLTNRRISGRGASIVETENGKIKRFTDYYDNASFFPPARKDTTGQ